MASEEAIAALKAFGFSEKEIQVYLANLELGSATANQIAEKSGINRSTCYDVLRSFITKGIVSKIDSEGTAHFDVASPEKLISMLEESGGKLKNVLPELREIQKQTVEKPAVKVFQGLEGFKTILNDILDTKMHTDVISTSKVFDVMRYNFPNYITRRSELGISARVIQEDSAQTKRLQKKDSNEKRQTRSINGFFIDSMQFIYSDKIATIKLVKDEIICVLIKDKNLADDHRKIFEELWRKAK